ncbi:hypothetical protein [Serratia fonticola]
MTWFSVAIAVAPQLISILLFMHNARKDQHQIAIELVKELRLKRPNKYLIERLFYELYRCSNVSFSEITILFKSPAPMKVIQAYTQTRRWLDVFEIKRVSGEVIIEFGCCCKTLCRQVIIGLLAFFIALGLQVSAITLSISTSRTFEHIIEFQKRHGSLPDFDASIWPDLVLYSLGTLALAWLAIYFVVLFATILTVRCNANKILSFYTRR